MSSAEIRGPALARPGSWTVTVGAMVLFVIALVAVMAAAAVQSRSRALQEAERMTQDAARLLEAQMAYVLDVASTILALQTAIADDADLSRESVRLTISRDLRTLLRDKPYIFRAFVADSTGEVVAGSLDPLPRLNVTTRGYFPRHAAGETGPVLTTGVQSQASGEPIMILTRRLDQADGRFGGVVIVSFNLDVLRDLFGSLAPAEYGSVFQLIASDMSILVDVSPPPDLRGTRLSDAEADSLRESRTGRIKGQDDHDRIWVNRRVSTFPLHVRVGTSVPSVIARWQQDLASYALGSGIALVALIVLAGFVVIYGRREESAARALRELNSELERRVVERTSQLENLTSDLRNSLEEKDVLFKEVHHRVKNNLQVVSSMVRFSSSKVHDPAAKSVFSEIARRIRAIGLVHQTIYEQEATTRVALEPYLHQLAELEGDVYGASERGVAIAVKASGDLDLNNAISVGLIVSELIANSLKHAYPGADGGRISIEVTRIDGECSICVADDGVGMSPDVTDGTGLSIIKAVSGQLNAALTIDNEGGTKIVIRFAV